MQISHATAAAPHPYNGPARLAADNDGDGRTGAAALADGDAAARIASRAIAQNATAQSGTAQNAMGQNATGHGASSSPGALDVKA